MKIQVDVDPEVWRKARIAAFGMDKTMGEFVGLAIRDLLDLLQPGDSKPTPAPSQRYEEGQGGE